MTDVVKKQPLLSGLLILFLTAMIFANIGGNMYDGLLPLYLKDLNLPDGKQKNLKDLPNNY